MHKEDEKNEQSIMSFNDKGLKFIVNRNKNLFKFKIYNDFTNQIYQSQYFQLQRINADTIKAAFNQSITQVQYDLIKISDIEASLKFSVKLQYISGQFHEQILLKQVQLNSQEVINIQMQQLNLQVKKIEQMLNEKLDMQTKGFCRQLTAYNSNSNKLWEFKLQKGKYLIQLFGMVISSKIFNGQSEQFDDVDMGIYHSHSVNFTISNIAQNIKATFTQKPHWGQAYEYPYWGSAIIQLNVKSDDLSDLMLNINVLNVVPLSVLSL